MQNLVKQNIANKIKNKKVLVAVSGGVDSMVLLYILNNLRKELDFYIEVIHVNHNLRNEDSDKDAELVATICENYNINCHIESIDVRSYKEKNKQTLEQAARNLRHSVINDYFKKSSFDYKIFAHNSDDQAETVLMHIFRGSGLKGATGIQETNEIIRPLLKVAKSDIYKFAHENNIDYREDESNTSIEYSRNFIRHIVFPKIEEVYPAVKQNLVKFAEIISEEENYINSTIDFNGLEKELDCIKVKVDLLKSYRPVAVRLIQKAINELGVFYDIETKHINETISLCDLKNGSAIDLPHGIFVQKEYNFVVFGLDKDKKIQKTNQKFKFGKINIGNKFIEVYEVNKKEISYGNGDFYFDIDKIPNGSVFRYRQNGDKFHKLNSGTITLSDVLTDKKIPARQRDQLIVLANSSQILFCEDIDISDDIKVTENTIRFGKINIKHF